MPAIGRSLGASFTDIEWVVSSYVLSFAALLLAAGSYADHHGRKRGMLIGIFLFATASAACGFANSSLFLNIARAVQGVGGSLLLTAALAVIAHAFEGPERARAYAFWGACLGIAMTAGPIVGGVITGYLGWRWVFLVNVPICAALFSATFAIIHELRDEEVKRLDIAGIVTFSIGLFLLIWALIDGNAIGWTCRAILLRLAGAGLLFVAFGVAETRQTRPMVDFTLFRGATFLGSAFAMLGYAAGAQVMIFYLPLFLQNAYGFKPMAAGLAMLPFALPMFLAPRVGARLANHYSGRTLLTVGLTVTVIGDLLLWAVAGADLPYTVFVASMLVAGTGAGLLNSETAKVMQGAVPAQRAGMASGIAGTTRFVGLLLGVAGLGAVLAKIASRQFVTAVTALGVDPAIAVAGAKRVTSGNIAGTLDGIAGSMQAQIHAAGLAAFADGFAAASLLAAALARSRRGSDTPAGARDRYPTGRDHDDRRRRRRTLSQAAMEGNGMSESHSLAGFPHPLDHPIWNALTTRQRAIAEGNGLAWRYPADIAPFAAMIDTSPASFAALAQLVTPSARIAMFTVRPIAPPDLLKTVVATTAEQMVATSIDGASTAPALVPLGETDVPAMLELVELTKPGPFGVRTGELGTFLGIRVGNRLAAMAGERMKLDGFTEITAVCTHPAYRGKGYARTLLQAVSRGIFARGETPFLHVFSDNKSAIELYRRSGFAVRRQMHLTALGRDA